MDKPEENGGSQSRVTDGPLEEEWINLAPSRQTGSNPAFPWWIKDTYEITHWPPPGDCITTIVVRSEDMPIRGMDLDVRAQMLRKGGVMDFIELGLANESDCQRRSRKQFSEMLFDASGNIIPGGYRDLKALRSSLATRREGAWQKLYREALRCKQKLIDWKEKEADELMLICLEPESVRNYMDADERLMVLKQVLKRFEISGRLPKEWEFMEEHLRRQAAPSTARNYAALGVKLYDKNPGEYSSRRQLLEAIIEEDSFPGTVRSLTDQLGGLYPQSDTSGRPVKEESRRLLREMVGHFRLVARNGKTGRNGR